MSRVKRGVTKRARHKKILKLAKGYRGRAKNCYRIAIQKVEKALQYTIVIEEIEREILENFGFKESMLVLEIMVLFIPSLLMV